MKKLFFLFSTLLALSGCAPESDFQVKLTLLDEELGEDSNSQGETLVINGYKGSYHWVYDGYHPDEEWDTDRKYSFELSDEDMHMLTLLIRENGLMVDREATISTGEPWSAFDLTWEMSMGGQSAKGHVVGEAVSWEDYSQTEDQMGPDESLFAAEVVFDFIKEKVSFEY